MQIGLIDNEGRVRDELGHCAGGAEHVAFLNHESLPDSAFHVFNDSLYGDLKMPFNTIEWHKARGNKRYYSTRGWEDWLSSLTYDRILSHVIKLTPLNAMINIFGSDLIQFEFRNPGGQMDISKCGSYVRLLKLGGKIIFVSSRQRQLWIELEHRVSDTDFIKNCPVITHCVFKDGPDPDYSLEKSYPLILGRADPEKKILETLKYYKNPINYVLYVDNEEYFSQIKKMSHPDSTYTLNASRNQVNEMIDRSTFLISTLSKESSGLNAFEALERGCPIVLINDSRPHASNEFAQTAYGACINMKNRDFKTFSQPANWLDPDFRRSTRDKMRVYTKEAYAEKLKSIVLS